MPEIFITNIPRETLSVMEVHARQARKPRQQYLHDLFCTLFGPEQSTVASIAERLRMVFHELSKLNFHGEQTPTVATVAEKIGHENPLALESTLLAQRPLSFADANKLCDLLGIRREWLLNGSLYPFYQAPQFEEPAELMEALATDNFYTSERVQHRPWRFVLSAGAKGKAAIYAPRPGNPYRFDLLVRNVPLAKQMGGTGTARLFDFGILCAAINGNQANPKTIPIKFSVLAHVLDNAAFDDLVNGRIHPGYAALPSHGHDAWHADFWDLEFNGEEYTEGFAGAKKIFRKVADDANIRNNNDLRRYAADRITDLKQRAMNRTNTARTTP